VGESTKYRSEARIIGIVTADNRNDPQAWKALEECDTAEFRADLWEASRIPSELKSFRAECLSRFGRTLETIFTIRLVRDGGAWPDASAADREKIWLSLGLNADDAPCEWIDLEVEILPSVSSAMRAVIDAGRVKLLASHHNLQASYSPSRLKSLGSELVATGSDGVKLAVTCRTRAEVEELLAFARDIAAMNDDACVLSMGRPGRVSRVLAPLLGCPLTYGYLSGRAVASGQLSVRQLREFYEGLASNAPGGLAVAGPLAGGPSDPPLDLLMDWAEARLPGEALAE
jgi:3-dehydroquinate dehydratase-1